MSHTSTEAERLTIFCTETDRHGSRTLHEWLVALAKEKGLAGATAVRADVGFGQHRRLHHHHLISLTEQLPMIVQIIDTAQKIDAYLDAAGEALRGYTYIRENVRWHRPQSRSQ